jgi:hypothetical protein
MNVIFYSQLAYILIKLYETKDKTILFSFIHFNVSTNEGYNPYILLFIYILQC